MNGKPIALLLAACVLAGCKNPEESARQELKDRGYEFTPEAFFRAAESDDVGALAGLVEQGMAVDTRNAAGDTALHAAAVAGMRKSADFLLDRKLPVDVEGAEGRTPLMAVVLAGPPAMARYLLSQKADPLKKDAAGYKPLMLAVKAGRADMVAELAPYDREKLDDALLVAALEGRAAVIDELTNYGASVYARMDDGRTALMLAAQNGHLEAVEMLIGIGANRFAMDDEGRIAADLARESGHEQLALRMAEAPTRDEFGIDDPADLGAAMLAKIREDEGEADLPAGAVARQPVVLDGVVLESAAAVPMPSKTGATGGAAPLVMRAYRQKELPLRVDSVREGSAVLRLAGGTVAQVAVGGSIPGTPLKVVRMERRVQADKDRTGTSEVSVVEVEDERSGRRCELMSGLESTAHDPAALVEDASGKHYVARAGQEFRGADGVDYVVVDVRPNQMVIENRGTGEVITAPLRGPRG